MPDPARFESMPRIPDTGAEHRDEQPKPQKVDSGNVAEIDAWRARVNGVRKPGAATEAPLESPAQQLAKLQAKYAEDYAAYNAETDPADKEAMARNLRRAYERIQALEAKINNGADIHQFPTGEKITPEQAVLNQAQAELAAAEARLAEQKAGLEGSLGPNNMPKYKIADIVDITAGAAQAVEQARKKVEQVRLDVEAASVAEQMEGMIASWAKTKSAEEFNYLMSRPPEEIKSAFEMWGGKPDPSTSPEAITSAMKRLSETYKK